MTRTAYWVFTLNNPEPPYNVLPPELAASTKYAVWQLEQGEQGTKHLQGYLELDKRRQLGAVRRLLPRAHLEPRRGSRGQATAYARKEDTRLEGPWQHGDEPPPTQQGKRSDLDALATELYGGASLERLRETFPGASLRYSRAIRDYQLERQRYAWSRRLRLDIRCYILWGAEGTGKTRAVYDKFGLDKVYTLNTATNGTLWFDGYEEHPVLLIDDFRGWIKYCECLKICDIYPYRCPIKFGFTWAAWKIVVFTSNHEPSTWWREESEHFFPAFLRRVHRTISFTHHPWSGGSIDVFQDVSLDEPDTEELSNE